MLNTEEEYNITLILEYMIQINNIYVALLRYFGFEVF